MPQSPRLHQRGGGHPLTFDSRYMVYRENHRLEARGEGSRRCGSTKCENERNIMINARDVREPEDERLPEEDEEVDTENDDVESEEDDEEELDEEEGDD